jgi:hypothetical protein
VTRPDTFRVLERPRYATPGTDGRYPRPLNEVAAPRVRYALDGRDILSFAVPATSDLRELLTARRVIELKPRGEPTSEWLISRVTEAAGPEGNGIFVVECDPVRVILGDAGIIEFVEVGGQSYTNLGGLNGTARNFLRTFAIEHLTRRGITWVVNGTIEPVQQFDFSWDALTPLALIEGIAKETGTEWSLRDNPAQSRYEIDLVERVGGQIEQVEARDGLNILQLQTSRNRERLFTSIRPSGGLAQGAEERANIGWATWRVADVTGDVIEIEPRGGGFGAILEDGQHVGLYLEAADGTFHEIEDSDEGNQTLTLETGAGASFAVDDDVQIVADDQGTLLTSLESPSGVSAFGFVQGQATSRALGHRNWVRNPFLAHGPGPTWYTGTAPASGSATTSIALVGLPASTLIPADSLLKFTGPGLTNLGSFVASDATTDGSGNVTLAVTSSTSWAAGQQFHIGIGLPVAADDIIVSSGYPIWGGGSDVASDVGQYDGTYSATTDCLITIKGLPVGRRIPAGTVLSPVTVANVFVLEDAVVDGTGRATLRIPLNTNATDNANVTLTYPNTGNATRVLYRMTGIPRAVFTTTPVYVRAEAGAGNDKVWARARYHAIASSSGWGPNPSPAPIRIRKGTTVVASAVGPEWTPTAPDVLNFNLEVSAPLESGTYDISVADTSAPSGYALGVSALQISVGPTPQPFVEGSAATRLFQEGQLALLASRQWPATYTVRLSEIVSEWGLDPLSPSLGLGNFIRLRSPSTGVDAILRIVAIEFDPTDPSEKIFTLDSDPERISTLTSKARPRAVFVDVDITVDQDGRARETVLVSESPPVAAPGSERFVVPEGSTAPTGDIVLEVTPLPPPPPSIGLTP